MSRASVKAVDQAAAAPELSPEQLIDARTWIQAARASAIERFP